MAIRLCCPALSCPAYTGCSDYARKPPSPATERSTVEGGLLWARLERNGLNDTALEPHHAEQPDKTMTDQNADAEPTGDRKKRRKELWSWALVGSALGILGFGFVSLGEAYDLSPGTSEI